MVILFVDEAPFEEAMFYLLEKCKYRVCSLGLFCNCLSRLCTSLVYNCKGDAEFAMAIVSEFF